MYEEGQVVVGSMISLKGELRLTGEPECSFKEVMFQLSPGGRRRVVGQMGGAAGQGTVHTERTREEDPSVTCVRH